MDINSLSILLAFILPLYAVYQLGSLAGIFSERAGVANVAIEGNMILGAVLYAVLFQIISGIEGMNEIAAIVISLVLTTSLASTYMMLLSHATNKYMGDHIIIGTGMNLLAPAIGFLLYFMFSPNVPALHPTNFTINYGDYMNIINNGVVREKELLWIHVVFAIGAIVIAIISAWVLNKTKFGLRLKSSGENPYALETSGVGVAKTRRNALYIAGMLSALAGAAFVSKDTFFFTVKGSGFLAIGIMILGQYRVFGTIIGSVLMAVLIGYFDAVVFLHGPIANSEIMRQYQVLLKAIPFIIPLIGLMIFRKSYVPKSVGQNFKKDQR